MIGAVAIGRQSRAGKCRGLSHWAEGRPTAARVRWLLRLLVRGRIFRVGERSLEGVGGLHDVNERQARPTRPGSNDALRRILAVRFFVQRFKCRRRCADPERDSYRNRGAIRDGAGVGNSLQPSDNRSGATRTISSLAFHPVVIPEFQTAIATSTSLPSLTTR
jgi:hypothetical protein